MSTQADVNKNAFLFTFLTVVIAVFSGALLANKVHANCVPDGIHAKQGGCSTTYSALNSVRAEKDNILLWAGF